MVQILRKRRQVVDDFFGHLKQHFAAEFHFCAPDAPDYTNVTLLRDGECGLAILNVMALNILGLFMIWIDYVSRQVCEDLFDGDFSDGNCRN
jgi:hypothetical protein